jgi:hypothetical protein
VLARALLTHTPCARRGATRVARHAFRPARHRKQWQPPAVHERKRVGARLKDHQRPVGDEAEPRVGALLNPDDSARVSDAGVVVPHAVHDGRFIGCELRGQRASPLAFSGFVHSIWNGSWCMRLVGGRRYS